MITTLRLGHLSMRGRGEEVKGGGPHPPTKSLEEEKKRDAQRKRRTDRQEQTRLTDRQDQTARAEERARGDRHTHRPDRQQTVMEIRRCHWLEQAGDGDFRWVAPLSSLDWVPLDPCLSRGFEVTQV